MVANKWRQSTDNSIIWAGSPLASTTKQTNKHHQKKEMAYICIFRCLNHHLILFCLQPVGSFFGAKPVFTRSKYQRKSSIYIYENVQKCLFAKLWMDVSTHSVAVNGRPDVKAPLVASIGEWKRGRRIEGIFHRRRKGIFARNKFVRARALARKNNGWMRRTRSALNKHSKS